VGKKKGHTIPVSGQQKASGQPSVPNKSQEAMLPQHPLGGGKGGLAKKVFKESKT